MQLLPYHIFLLLYYGLLDGFDIQRSKQFCDSLWFKWKHISKEDADSSADFSLSIASELYEELTCDNITYVLLGEAYEKLDIREIKYGTYNFSAEIRKSHRITYF